MTKSDKAFWFWCHIKLRTVSSDAPAAHVSCSRSTTVLQDCQPLARRTNSTGCLCIWHSGWGLEVHAASGCCVCPKCAFNGPLDMTDSCTFVAATSPPPPAYSYHSTRRDSHSYASKRDQKNFRSTAGGSRLYNQKGGQQGNDQGTTTSDVKHDTSLLALCLQDSH